MKYLLAILFIIQLSNLTSHAQWFTQQSGTTNPLYDIEFANRNTGWACGDDGYIIKTTNGGINWIQQGNGVTHEPLFGISIVDSNTVYAAGFFRTLVKTTNGGVNWVKKESGMIGDGTYTCLFFINENTGWIGNFDSPDYGVRKTTDGGNTIFSNNFLGYPEDLYFKDSLNGIGVGGVSQIFKTINGGQNWNINLLLGTGDFYRVSFIDGYTGFTGSHRAVYKTTNFGVTWDSIGDSPGQVSSIEFANENTGWAGTQSPFFKTTDGGRNWFLQFLTGVVYSIYAFNDSLVWTCGNGGRIWHTANGGTSSISKISSLIPDFIELYQNYPNPFNSQTKISFSIKQKGNFNLEIYDITGQKVSEIFNNQINVGTYEVTFDATELSSGIYFYKLTGSNKSITKKFILMK